MGIDKKRKQEEGEADSRFSLRSEASEVDERGKIANSFEFD